MPTPNEPVTQEVMADLLDVDPRTVRELVERGLVFRVGRGRYDMRLSVRAYVGHMRAMAAGRGSNSAGLTAERAREARERADHMALKNATMRGELVEADAVEDEWRAGLTDIRARLLAVPGRFFAQMPGLTPADRALLEREVREALTEAAE